MTVLRCATLTVADVDATVERFTRWLTAWNALAEFGRIKSRDLVLTLGTGGVSILALQIANAAGGRVAITSSSEEKLARARSLGADITINYRTTPDWAKALLEATSGQGPTSSSRQAASPRFRNQFRRRRSAVASLSSARWLVMQAVVCRTMVASSAKGW